MDEYRSMNIEWIWWMVGVQSGLFKILIHLTVVSCLNMSNTFKFETKRYRLVLVNRKKISSKTRKEFRRPTVDGSGFRFPFDIRKKS